MHQDIQNIYHIHYAYYPHPDPQNFFTDSDVDSDIII